MSEPHRQMKAERSLSSRSLHLSALLTFAAKHSAAQRGAAHFLVGP